MSVNIFRAVRVYKASGFRIIISALEIIESCFRIIDIAAIAERVANRAKLQSSGLIRIIIIITQMDINFVTINIPRTIKSPFYYQILIRIINGFKSITSNKYA